MSKKLKVLLIFDSPYKVARGHDFKEEFKDFDWDTERFVYEALQENEHEIKMLGIHDDIHPLLDEISEFKPDIVFNLVEVFDNKSNLDKDIAGLLELLGVPYTGACPRVLMICNHKALCKKILSFHKIKVPNFYVFNRGKKVWLPKKLKLPVIVKPVAEEASRGISQASVVDTEEALIERVRFIHESVNDDAIAEEYIDGREFYVSVIGDKKLQVFPLREMKFGQFPEDEPRIATFKAKWDYDYRERWGIKNTFAGRIPDGMQEKVEDVCKRAYRAIEIKSYARFDIRVNPDGVVYILEVNANPNLDKEDEMGEAAIRGGIPYPKLINKIISLALTRHENSV